MPDQGRWSETAPPDRSRCRLLLATSTTALVLAAPVAITLHELAHAVTGLAVGLNPTLHSNFVDYDPEPDPARAIVTAAAGPLFSLVLGLVVFLTARSAGRGFGRLFWLWTGLVSMQNFFGYLLIAPFAGVGDTGQVLHLLGASTAAYVVCGVLGALLTLLSSRLLAGQVTRYARDRDELRHLVLFPWLIATAITVALTPLDLATGSLDPAAVPVVLAGAVSIAIFAPMFSFFYRGLNPPHEALALRQPVVPLIATVVLTVLIAVFLGPGIHLG